MMANTELRAVAERVVWFQPPDTTLANPRLFLAHAMRYAVLKDLLTVMRHFRQRDFLDVLSDPPAGLFDDRSWAFWHLRLGKDPAPPLPERRIPKVSESSSHSP